MSSARRCEADDLARVAVVLARAFADYPPMNWMVPDDDHHERLLVLMAALTAGVGLDRREMWITDDCVAAAVWAPPGDWNWAADPAIVERIGADLVFGSAWASRSSTSSTCPTAAPTSGPCGATRVGCEELSKRPEHVWSGERY